jgi:hypothetical protein
LLVLSFTANANDLTTESRIPFLHNIQLHDAQGKVITPPAALTEDGKPQDSRATPYSPAQTCGKCHDYATISQGWHFNAAQGNVKPGRPGEPWIFTDPATHTQIPFSYRGWPGTFKPSDLGISDYDFITNFARHFPGGGVGEPAKIDAADPRMGRMQITGALEIDCLLCHQSTGRYDIDSRFTAVKGQDFRWAPSVGAGLGTFASFRSAGAMADQWKPGRTVTTNLPAIRYNRARFDADNNVTFQVARRAPANNCYYCHTTETSLGDARWHSDTDVHLRAGMLCVDCHRNGLDHMVVRGYDGESKDRSVTDPMVDLRVKMLRRDNAALTDDDAKKLARTQLQSELSQIDTLSCRGCHMSGRLGSPALIHKGMPPIHFEKLSCTACHSGPLPTPDQTIVHTSLAHKLGLPAPARGKETAPIIIEPIFLRGENQLISPYKMVWPSYWAHLKDGKVTPILPAEAAKTGTMPKQPSDDIQRDPYNTKPLAAAQIQSILQSFPENSTNGQTVYIAAGKLFRLEKNQLISEENPAAKPYAWALAHDVRPASQALGARGCADCHSADSQVYFANVVARGPIDATNALSKGIWEMRGDDKKVGSLFAYTFVFRPMLKVIVFGASLIVLAVLIHYGLRGVGAITAVQSRKTPP